MERATLIRMIGIVGFLGLVAGMFFWKQRDVVTVEVSSLSGKQITFAIPDGSQQFVVEPGKTRLPKGVYVYTLKSGSQEKSGLIAVNDASPIILK